MDLAESVSVCVCMGGGMPGKSLRKHEGVLDRPSGIRLKPNCRSPVKLCADGPVSGKNWDSGG